MAMVFEDKGFAGRLERFRCICIGSAHLKRKWRRNLVDEDQAVKGVDGNNLNHMTNHSPGHRPRSFRRKTEEIG
jgi:hypothetical protein